jgi:hypothetical protein
VSRADAPRPLVTRFWHPDALDMDDAMRVETAKVHFPDPEAAEVETTLEPRTRAILLDVRRTQ